MHKNRSSRKRRTEGQWAEIVRRFESSGQDSSEFCRREGLAQSSLQRWRRRLGSAAPRFVELTPTDAPGERETSWSLEVALPNGMSLQFRG
jgi:transposase-like protein